MATTLRVFDVEVYPNFFLALFKEIGADAVIRVQISPNRTLDRALLLHTLTNSTLYGFNSSQYDLTMIQLALKGYSTLAIKEVSDQIIAGYRPRDIAEEHGLACPPWDHVDLKPIAPLDASLKLYAARMHAKKLQDLPIDPSTELTAEQAALIAEYCLNDLANTELLHNELRPQIDLRTELSLTYRQDLRSKSDAQVAEAVIAAEVEKINGVRPQRPQGLIGRAYRYRVPDYISFDLPQLQELLAIIRDAEFVVGAKGAIELPASLSGRDVQINSALYRIGIGGLHSSETQTMHVASEDVLLIDRDVTSYYPSIILGQGLYPQHLGEAFLTVYRSLVERRLAAKRAGDKTTAESLKIAINGSYGKLGSQWSSLYSPDLLIQVTLTGQLALLMLIEQIEAEGIRVVSANTDGVLIRCTRPRLEQLQQAITRWERSTGFLTEEAHYSAVYSKDVNNYIAIKTDGKVKGKGLYTCPWDGLTDGPAIFRLHKNPCTTVVTEAVIKLLRDRVPVEDTIVACRDIRKFTAVRTVRGGASRNGEYVGKVVRWYYSMDSNSGVLNYKKSGYKVPKSDGSKSLMELPDKFPADVDHTWYIDEAHRVLLSIGHEQHTLFDS